MWFGFSNLITMLWSKIILFFGYKYDKSVIPTGSYCYKPNDELNKNYGKNGQFIYYTIPCEYYKPLNKQWNGCKYYGIITNDSIFDDRCKICDINDEDEDDEEILLRLRTEKIDKIRGIFKK